MQKKQFSVTQVVAVIGPGILVAATGVGAGDLATGAFTGNKLGTAVLWAVLLGAFLKFVLTEGLARWQLATGETLLEGAIHRLGPLVEVIFLPYLLLWSFFVGAALISACGVAMHAIMPVFENPAHGKLVFGVLHSLLGIGLVLKGGFPLFRKIMMVCIGVMFLVVVTTAYVVCEDWEAVGRGLLVPTIPRINGPGLGWLIALMGGVGGTLTILCYGYWMRESGRVGVSYMKVTRIDLALAYAVTAVFGMSMVIIGSAIPELPPAGGATLVVHLANLLEDSLGPVGRWAFLLGAWSAVFSSLFGVMQSVPYLFADFWRMQQARVRRIDLKVVTMSDLKGYASYKIYLWAIGIIPMLGLVVEFSRIQKVYAIFGAFFMPLVAIVLLILNGRRRWVGSLLNGSVTTLLLAGTLLVFLFFAYLQIRKQLG